MVHIENRNLYRLTRFVIFKISFLFRLFAIFRKDEKRLLIIKTDAIGDYILFRNFIEVLKASEKYKGYQVDLLGNLVWQDLALKLDAAFINEFLFIKPLDLYEAPLKTLKLGWRLLKRNYEAVLCPAYTRTFINDGIAALTAAKQIIGFDGDTELIYAKYKKRTDKFYTQKLSLPASVYFEFDRNRFFFENILDLRIALPGPFIKNDNRFRNGITIFPGAGTVKRSWEPAKFVELIKLIKKHTDEPIYLAGGTSEIAAGNYIVENLPPQTLNNLIGKTTLPKLVELTGNSVLIIANETSAVHIAAAVQTKAVCILGGGHFERFAPYPTYVKSKPLCVFEKMDCYYCNWNCIFPTEQFAPHPCVSNVSLESVWLATQQMLAAV